MNHFTSGYCTVDDAGAPHRPARARLVAGAKCAAAPRFAAQDLAPLSAAALAFTMTGWITGVPPPILVAIALAAGAVVALELRLPSYAGTALLAAAAVAIGLDSGADTGPPFAIAGTLLGTWVSLGLGLVNIAYYASLAAERKQKWISIGLRIAGSWIVAIFPAHARFLAAKCAPGITTPRRARADSCARQCCLSPCPILLISRRCRPGQGRRRCAHQTFRLSRS